MNVQDNTNLAVEYLEVITCTYEELCNIKTPSNGRLYHTSDTNEFYFDWNNRRHKLSVFASDSNIKDVVKKSELNAWLAEHNYVTNLSLVDELVNIIGSPIENIITKQALENYSKNYLLTKEEFGLLNEPLSLIEDIKSLQTSNRSLYAYCDRLANSINEVRSEANNRISSGELDTKLNEYLKTSLAESIYLSKDEADTLYIDEDEFLEKVQNYMTRNQLTESLKPYLKKSEVGSIYATKEDVNNKYLLKTIANNTFVTKNELQNNYVTKESVDVVLDDYLTKNEANSYLKKDVADSTFAKKSDLSNVETKSSVNEKLSTFANRMWVDNLYIRKDSIKDILSEYVTKEYVSHEIENINNKNGYIEDIDDKISKINDKLSTFATKKQVSDIKESFGTFSNRMWVDNLYLRKDSIKDILGEYATKEYVDSKFLRGEDDSSIDDKIEQVVTEINNKLSKYATKEQVSDIKKSLSSFANKIWVEEHYLHESDLDKKFEGYATLEYINEILDRFEEKDVTDEKLRQLSNDINNRLSKFATRTQVSELNDRMSSLAQKNWVSNNFIRKGDSSGEPTDLSGYATEEYVNEKLDGYATKELLTQKTSDINNKFYKYATKEQLSSVSSVIPTLAQRNWVSTNFIDNNELLNELKKYASVVYINKTLENYMTSDSINELLSQKITELNNKFSKYVTNDQLSDIRETLTAFAKKIWVDEFYMKKFKLSDYMKADDIYSIFLEKDVADNIYLTKQDADNIYAKISSIINYTDNDCVTREEASAFAKKVWVDEYYMRKTQFEGIKNAIVLSREFAHESELKQYEGKFIQQGFYYLTAEDTLFCVIDNGQGTGEKIFVNITQLEAGFALYFGGDDVNW